MAKKIWDGFILAGPIFGLISAVALLAKSAPFGAKQSLVESAAKVLGVQTLSEKTMNRLAKIGQRSMAFSWVMRSLNGIVAGLGEGQPTMILGNLIQLIPSIKLATKESASLRQLVLNMGVALGGLFTVGYAQSIKNKDPNTNPADIRRYDMSKLKALFDSKSGMSVLKRVSTLFSELVKMTGFAIKDHWIMVQDLVRSGKSIVNNDSETSRIDRLKTWATNPTSGKSQASVLLFYLGAIPAVLIALITKKNAIWDNKLVMVLKGVAMLLANLAPFTIALNRDDLRGKASMVGAPLALLGTAISNPGLAGLGDSLNDIHFSDMAVNGLKTHTESKNKS